jgi:hypothetical protein
MPVAKNRDGGAAHRRQAERATRRSKEGGGTGVFPVGLRLRLGSRAQGLPFCRAAGHIGVRARAGARWPGTSEAVARRGRKKKGEEDGRW